MDTAQEELRIIVPLGTKVLIRKEKDKEKTKGGIVLPGSATIPNIHARVLEIGGGVEKELYPIQRYDKVIVIPNRMIPVDVEEVLLHDGGNQLFIVPIEDIVAIIKPPKKET